MLPQKSCFPFSECAIDKEVKTMMLTGDYILGILVTQKTPFSCLFSTICIRPRAWLAPAPPPTLCLSSSLSDLHLTFSQALVFFW